MATKRDITIRVRSFGSERGDEQAELDSIVEWSQRFRAAVAYQLGMSPNTKAIEVVVSDAEDPYAGEVVIPPRRVTARGLL